jgi:hypothetical protein
MALRTASGAPSVKARVEYGNSQGKFPIFDQHSAESALRLRGHSSDPDEVLARVRHWADEYNNSAVKAMVHRVTGDG